MIARAHRRREYLLAAIASLLAIGGALLALELALRVRGYGEPSTRRDPFAGFAGTSPMFVERGLPGKPAEMVTSPNKASWGIDVFLRDKPSEQIRIFTFGGSTTYGSPWGTAGSYSAWLEQALAERHPDRSLEVINTGVSGWGSSRNLEVLREATAYAPDLFIVYAGINEYFEVQYFPRETTRSRASARVLSLLFASRALYFLHERAEVLRARILGPRMTSRGAARIAEVVATGNFPSFDYYRVPALAEESEAAREPSHLREQANALFRENVRAMIEAAHAHRIPLVFVLNAWNPRASDLIIPTTVAPDAILPADEDRWRERYAAGVEAMRAGEYAKALEAFDGVAELYRPAAADHDSLLPLYRTECFERLGRFAEARTEIAKREARAHRELNQILREAASQHDVALLDLPRLLEEHAEDGLVGYHNFFIDTEHLTLPGYRLLGRSLAAKIDEWGLLGVREAPAVWDLDPAMDDPFPPQFHNAKTFTAFAWSAFQQGRTEEAVDLARRAIAHTPNEIQAHLLLGYAYQKLGDVAKVEAELAFLREHWQRAVD